MAAAEPRTLALAAGAATRAYTEVKALVKHTDTMPPPIAVQGRVIIEELDLLRFYLREQTLLGVIEPAPAEAAVTALQRQRTRRATAAALKLQAPRAPVQAPASGKAKGGHARAASLAPAKRKAIAQKAAKARWGWKQLGRK